jgi:hypothetical protein
MDLSNRKYFEKALFCLNDAKKCILVGMYIITLDQKAEDSKTGQLLSALVSAKKRGVNVKVIMEYHSGLDLTPHGMRNNAYQYLLQNGIDVSFDKSAQRCAHLKTIVIDGEIVITGSANWSNMALDYNDETNVLIYSKPLAEEISVEILSIPLFRHSAIPAGEYFDIQLFMMLDNHRILRDFISAGDERAMDTALLLLYNGGTAISFEFIADKLGIVNKMGRAAYRRQIIKVLRKLQNKYRLAEFSISYNSNEIGIKWLLNPAGQPLLFPKTYFDSGWNKILSLPAKTVLTALYAEFSGKENPDIETFISNLAKKYGIKKFTFSSALQELKRYNIVKVYYSAGFKDRNSTKIIFTGLYNLNDFKQALDEMYKQYGRKNVAYARHFANIVYCAYDLDVVRDILKQISRRGTAIVRKAFYITAEKKPDNPQRTYIYTLGIMKKLSK